MIGNRGAGGNVRRWETVLRWSAEGRSAEIVCDDSMTWAAVVRYKGQSRREVFPSREDAKAWAGKCLDRWQS